MRNWDQLVDNYRRVCEARGLSAGVVQGRGKELDRFGLWLKRRRPKPQVEDVNAELILEYVKARTTFHAKSSVCGVMSHLRCMGEYLVNEGVWLQNPLRWIQSPKIDPRNRLPRRIDPGHLSKLMEQAAQVRQAYHRSLIFTILVILYGTGMRRGELERLNLSDWDSRQQTLRVDNQKVNLQRVVPVPPAVASAIEAYLPQRQNHLMALGIQDEPSLFINRDGLRVKGAHVGIAVHKLAKKAKIPLVTVHQFRHTCASDLLDEGLGLHEVQKYLGHAYICTTIRYTQVSDPARKQAVALHPINAILSQLNTQQEGVAHEIT